jgi:signal peptidase I
MADNSTPPSPPPPPPSDDPKPQGPWIYSGGTDPAGGFYSPPTPQPKPTPKYSPPAGTPPAAAQPASPAPAAPAPAPVATTAASRPAYAQRPGTGPSRPPAQDATLAHVIDTIEAIIIALIVALTFRAFIVEAFVIPTGSMAPTLLGAHFKVICPSCGYEFDRDARLEWQLRQVESHLAIVNVGNHTELTSNKTIPADNTLPIYCPNCMYPIQPKDLPGYLGTVEADDRERGRNPAGRASRDVPFAWANNGDRILVMKYFYSIMDPSRWDVIVFKEPQGAKDNYIKRLIGLPNETVEIINGDIYIAPPQHHEESDLAIQRKPEHLQQFLWQVIYDNDFYPNDEGKPRQFVEGTGYRNVPWTNPWVGATDAWTKGIVMAHNAPSADALVFQARPPYTENYLGYNDDMIVTAQDPAGPLRVVGDLRVEALWTPASDDALSVGISLGRPHNRFRTRWDTQGISLEQFDPATGAWHEVERAAHAAPEARHPYRISMNNVDRAVQFYIDGKRAISHETTWTAADAHRLEREEQFQPVRPGDTLIRIDVGGPSTLAHLKLFRDLYYTQCEGANVAHTANDGNPLSLGNDEFFAMGDNSRNSLDGRMWTEVFPALDDLGTRQGIVPRRYLLGKAFFVYWPAGFRPTTNDSVPLFHDLPLVPSTGDMRFIR